MYRKDFLPKNGADFKKWSDNLVDGLQQNPNLISQPKQQELESNILIMNTAYENAAATEAAYLRAMQELETIKAAQLDKVREGVNQIKKSENYNEAIGRSLKIISTAVGDKDWDDMKPNPKIKVLANAVQISYTKSKSEGVRIFSRRNGETEFKYLAQNTSSPFKDTRPNQAGFSSEQREYKLVYVKTNVLVGQFSDIVSANVSIQSVD